MSFRNSLPIFILSHMRSRSSLLAHILGSNREVAGYAESHRSYLTPQDLAQLRRELTLQRRQDLRGKYVIDNILHNSHKISPQIMKNRIVRFIFLLRQPESTIKSLIHMSLNTGIKYYAVPENALDYYLNRLSQLERYALLSARNGCFIESDELIENTGALLNDLTRWLKLSTPLRAQYSIFKNTGQFGYGDPLNNIKTGRVFRTEDHTDIHIPPALLTAAQKGYETCKRTLTTRLSKQKNSKVASGCLSGRPFTEAQTIGCASVLSCASMPHG